MEKENIVQESVLQLKDSKARKKKRNLGVTIFLCVMLAYPIFEFVVSWVFVKINSIFMAFQLPSGEWSLLSFEIVFKDMVSQQGDFTLAVAMKNTFLWLLFNTFNLFFHYFIAYVFYRKLKGTKFFRVMFYLPTILSEVVIITIFKNFIMSDGPLASLLANIGVKEFPQLLSNPDYANKTVFAYTFWVSWGGSMLLLGGAFARVPLEVVESAHLDGIGVWGELFKILFPMTWGSFSTILVLNFTSMFSVSNTLMILTAGYNGTVTAGYWIFHRTYFDGASQYNTVAAAGLLFTVIGLMISMFVRWLVERVPAVEY